MVIIKAVLILFLLHLLKCTYVSLKAICQDDEFEHQNQIFSLDYRTVSGDVSLPENAFRTQDFLPHGKQLLTYIRMHLYTKV